MGEQNAELTASERSLLDGPPCSVRVTWRHPVVPPGCAGLGQGTHVFRVTGPTDLDLEAIRAAAFALDERPDGAAGARA